MMSNVPETVMIVTGESSGELYGSLLASSLKTLRPDLHVIGVGGERMREAGVELVSGIAGAFGIMEALSSYKALKDTFERAVGAIKKYRPSVVVLIDYPDFNIKVGKFARALGAKILYYVSPQVWAWRKGRVSTLASVADRMAVILPFEVDIYKGSGVVCEFVGHPALDEINALDMGDIRGNLGLQGNAPLLALLPGSRTHELKMLLPVMLATVRNFKKDFPQYRFIMPMAPNINTDRYGDSINCLRDEGVIVRKENAIKVLSVSELAVIASGTATLQAAFLERPMVVVYKLSPVTYLLGKMLVDVKYISLVNILSGREVVREFLQDRATPANIFGELGKITSDRHYREEMISCLRRLKGPFQQKKPSLRVAEIVGEIAGWK